MPLQVFVDIFFDRLGIGQIAGEGKVYMEILIKVTAPDDYADVDPEIVFDDFLRSAESKDWIVELVREPGK